MDAAAYCEDGALYCESCAPEGADLVEVAESDSPQHCDACLCPLGNRLTVAGVDYVLARCRAALDRGLDWTIYPSYRGTYWEGSPHCAIVVDWADMISWYGLSTSDQDLVESIQEVYCAGIVVIDAWRAEYTGYRRSPLMPAKGQWHCPICREPTPECCAECCDECWEVAIDLSIVGAELDREQWEASHAAA